MQHSTTLVAWSPAVGSRMEVRPPSVDRPSSRCTSILPGAPYRPSPGSSKSEQPVGAHAVRYRRHQRHLGLHPQPPRVARPRHDTWTHPGWHAVGPVRRSPPHRGSHQDDAFVILAPRAPCWPACTNVRDQWPARRLRRRRRVLWPTAPWRRYPTVPRCRNRSPDRPSSSPRRLRRHPTSALRHSKAWRSQPSTPSTSSQVLGEDRRGCTHVRSHPVLASLGARSRVNTLALRRCAAVGYYGCRERVLARHEFRIEVGINA